MKLIGLNKAGLELHGERRTTTSRSPDEQSRYTIYITLIHIVSFMRTERPLEKTTGDLQTFAKNKHGMKLALKNIMFRMRSDCLILLGDAWSVHDCYSNLRVCNTRSVGNLKTDPKRRATTTNNTLVLGHNMTGLWDSAQGVEQVSPHSLGRTQRRLPILWRDVEEPLLLHVVAKLNCQVMPR